MSFKPNGGDSDAQSDTNARGRDSGNDNDGDGDDEGSSNENSVKLSAAELRLKTVDRRVARVCEVFSKGAMTDDEIIELVFSNPVVHRRSKMEDIALGTLCRGWTMYNQNHWVRWYLFDIVANTVDRLFFWLSTVIC